MGGRCHGVSVARNRLHTVGAVRAKALLVQSADPLPSRVRVQFGARHPRFRRVCGGCSNSVRRRAGRFASPMTAKSCSTTRTSPKGVGKLVLAVVQLIDAQIESRQASSLRMSRRQHLTRPRRTVLVLVLLPAIYAHLPGNFDLQSSVSVRGWLPARSPTHGRPAALDPAREHRQSSRVSR